MTSLPAPSEPYRIVRSAAFYADWDAGVAAGWLNPMVHPAQVEHFTRSVLPQLPFLGEQVPSAPVNVRKIRFPHSPRSPDVIELIYEVIEDDRTMSLEGIRLLP